jgi:hypothetical protein
VLEDLVSELDGEALTAGEELVETLEAAALRSVELRGALDCTDAEGASDELGPIPGTCVKDAVDATAPAEPGSSEEAADGGTEQGGDTTGEGEGDGGDAEAPTGGATGEDTNSPAADPSSDGASDPATDAEPTETNEDGDVLGELSGIISDLFD